MNVHRRRRSRLSELRRSLYLRVPVWMRKQDFELFTILLCFSAGVPLVVTGQVEAGSLDATVPHWMVIGWGAVLVVAPIMVGLGIWRTHAASPLRAIPWRRIHAAGLRLLAYAGYFYASVASITYAALNGALPAGAFIFIIFALTAHSRSADVTIKLENFLDGLVGLHDVE